MRGVAPDALSVLERYHWPGNIRELENVLERAVVLGAGDMLSAEALPESVRRERPSRGRSCGHPGRGPAGPRTTPTTGAPLLQRASTARGVQTKAASSCADLPQFVQAEKHSLAKRGAPGTNDTLVMRVAYRQTRNRLTGSMTGSGRPGLDILQQ